MDQQVPYWRPKYTHSPLCKTSLPKSLELLLNKKS
jgi:hypothetical protein